MLQTAEQTRGDVEDLSLVIFVASGMRFAVDLACVIRAMPACEIWRPAEGIRRGIGALRLEGHPVPILDPPALLRDDVTTKITPNSRFLLTRPRARMVGFVADEVLGVRRIRREAAESAARLGMGMARLRAVAADDDALIHIFDPERVFTAADETAFDESIAGDGR